jgi:hypothetical protein
LRGIFLVFLQIWGFGLYYSLVFLDVFDLRSYPLVFIILLEWFAGLTLNLRVGGPLLDVLLVRFVNHPLQVGHELILALSARQILLQVGSFLNNFLFYLLLTALASHRLRRKNYLRLLPLRLFLLQLLLLWLSSRLVYRFHYLLLRLRRYFGLLNRLSWQYNFLLLPHTDHVVVHQSVNPEQLKILLDFYVMGIVLGLASRLLVVGRRL